ncbi:hypothetical protein IAU60_005271 [Kwoniella sp. DSM 27419]
MTSRLKHKLELDNVNLNSAYLNESFVQIGTPLPALAGHKKDQLEYVPEWQQEVRDEQGRRRFHGAFTGGFSAGYFNTVGSKEGWAPSTFKSSRGNRAAKVQKAEDFMDEEDLQALRDDRRLENTDTFRSDRLGGTQDELAGKTLPSSLESLIAPANSSIGEKLLQKQGWRPGQGIGPRVTLRKLRIQEGKLGKARAGIVSEADDDDAAEAGKHTFAPRDARLLVYEAKEDRQGLGFIRGRGMGSLPGKRPVLGARHLDEDDDPYAEAGPSSRPFAFEMNADDDDIIVMGSSDQPGLGANASRLNRPGKENLMHGIAQDAWHDGRPVLAGFALDPKGVPPDKWFAMPEIPEGWRPRPARVWGTTRKWDEQPGMVKAEKEVIRGVPGRPLTFEERGAALGEEQRLSKAKSVFEYMSEKDKERLASIAASAQTGPPPVLKMEEAVKEVLPALPATEVIIPPLSPRTAGAALRGFIPYGDDPARQDRYKSYLGSQTYNTTTPNPVLKVGSFEEINKELQDFAASARIFRPMSYAMSNRFTAGSSSLAASDLKQAKPGLHIFDAEKAKAEMAKPEAATEVEVRKDLTPREMAAKNGMYGKMTRETKSFYPVKLLCKRFGVQDPHPEGDPGRPQDKGAGNDRLEAAPLPTNDASWESKFIHKPADDKAANGQETPQPAVDGPGRKPTSLAEVGMADDVNQGRDTLTYTKPSIDIFKAIFASDDEDEDEEDEAGLGQRDTGLGQVQTTEPSAQDSVMAKATVLDKPLDPYPVKEEGPVDLASFKPVFTLRREEAEKPKKKKDKDKGKKRKGVLSFDVGDDGDGEGDEGEKVEKRKKKERKVEPAKEAEAGQRDNGAEEAEGEWVEKPSVMPRLVGRKGAADYM